MHNPFGYRLIPHTADIGIEAWAEELEGVFVAAARGFRELLFGSVPIGTCLAQRVSVNANNSAELLVVWLNEILYCFEVKAMAPAEFEIQSLSNTALVAIIKGELYHPERHPVQHQVKAVTYHQLTLEQKASGWYGKVYVDL
ncbi:MAG: archease [Deltaproteobacteria bacterium]|jgi:SHS2 domain-containing protein|nr:archease [Deltaproteobacteria bacterium]MBW2504282.1 archease [Deltaproteobacteria bacterium]MBW2519822.1 archease [Deltaproteobacteria bacterium]